MQQLIFGNPATGTDSVYVVSGGNALWPLSVMCRLTTSGAAGERAVALEYRDGAGERFLVSGMPNTDPSGAAAGVGPSSVQSFCWVSPIRPSSLGTWCSVPPCWLLQRPRPRIS